MPIYTKTGDRGETSLFGGKRVSKCDLQIQAYGSIDELTSFIGLIVCKIKNRHDKLFLTQIQKDLYQMMAFLANAPHPIENIFDRIALFEQKIDSIESRLPKLHRFILPGGTEAGSLFHIVRSICRRTERDLVRLQNDKKISRTLRRKDLQGTIKYINRLSDLLFDYARLYAKGKESVT